MIIDMTLTTNQSENDLRPSALVTDIFDALRGLTVDLRLDSAGYPSEDVCVLRVDRRDGDVVVCETDPMGRPLDNAPTAIPQAAIRGLRVHLGDDA